MDYRSSFPPAPRRTESLIHFLTRPSTGDRKPERRRARMLAWTILTLILLISAALVLVLVNPDNLESRRALYAALISGLIVLLVFAFALNYFGRYSMSAGLTVACAIVGPWVSVLMDPAVWNGDFVPLVYITLSLFLSGILLPVRATVAICAVQFIAILVLAFTVPHSGPINWPSLIAFILFTSVLSIVSTIMSRMDLDQIAEQNALLVKREATLHELSIRDSLTGLFNRRFMEETLDSELDNASRNKTSLGIMIVDIDQFKRINDTYGHVKGDEIIRLTGIVLRTHIRLSDYICRYGGDEFVLILPGASLAIVKQRAERLRAEMEKIAGENDENIPEVITISLGIAVFPEHGKTREEILDAADSALYRAKENGRNCVSVAG